MDIKYFTLHIEILARFDMNISAWNSSQINSQTFILVNILCTNITQLLLHGKSINCRILSFWVRFKLNLFSYYATHTRRIRNSGIYFGKIYEYYFKSTLLKVHKYLSRKSVQIFGVTRCSIYESRREITKVDFPLFRYRYSPYIRWWITSRW